MQWFKRGLRQSIYGLLGHGDPTLSVLEDSLEEVRDAMLALLGDEGATRHASVHRRIRYAADIQGLWYLRGDLMGALATVHGEAGARARVGTITEMFHGLLPGSLASRPSPLVG